METASPISVFENQESRINFTFNGKTGDLFKIFIVNLFLLIVTLGFYYPWAKAKMLTFNYGETEFYNSKFTFHGTGKEMFGGLVKAILLFGTWYTLYYVANNYLVNYASQTGIIWPFIAATLLSYLLLGALIPLAIVGSIKYRASRSSWRGIHFQYTGTLKSMYSIFMKGVLLSIITLGIYIPWLMVAIFNEIADNLKWGNIRFRFKGEGGTLFSINFLGMFFTYLTLGIFYFKFRSNYRNYLLSHIELSMNEHKSSIVASTTGMGYFKLMMGNALIILFTLGLGIPFAMIRTLNYHAGTTNVEGHIDFNQLEQGELQHADSFGEGLMDTLDIDLI